MERFSRGWSLAGGSLRILWNDKRLLLFALCSGLCTIAAAAAILLPAFHGALDSGTPGARLPLLPLFLFYLASSFISMFFNTALAALVLARLQGSKLSIEQGLWIAVDHSPTILVLALLSAFFGMLLRSIERRFRMAGAITALFLGATWSIATLLVVPVMIIEDKGPFASLGRSVALVRKTWGEQAAGGLGIGMVGTVLSLPGLALIAKGFMLTDDTSRLACFAIAAVYLALLGLIVSTLEQILRAAIYVYVDSGTLPPGFDGGAIDDALGPN